MVFPAVSNMSRMCDALQWHTSLNLQSNIYTSGHKFRPCRAALIGHRVLKTWGTLSAVCVLEYWIIYGPLYRYIQQIYRIQYYVQWVIKGITNCSWNVSNTKVLYRKVYYSLRTGLTLNSQLTYDIDVGIPLKNTSIPYSFNTCNTVKKRNTSIIASSSSL